MVGGLRPTYLSGERIESGGAKRSHPPMNSGTRPQIRPAPSAVGNDCWLIAKVQIRPIAEHNSVKVHVQRLILSFVNRFTSSSEQLRQPQQENADQDRHDINQRWYVKNWDGPVWDIGRPKCVAEHAQAS